jgi:predicted RNase H-like nuclease (RuvC/YqgF family)
MTKLLGIVRDVYHMANISSLKSKKCKEIAQIQQMIEDNVKQFEFFDKEEHDIAQINFDISVTDNVIAQLETDIGHLLQMPFNQRDNAEFTYKSNKLHTLLQQQDSMKVNRNTIVQAYNENINTFNKRQHELTQRLDQLKQELFEFEKRVNRQNKSV